jgi:hypothetical protein
MIEDGMLNTKFYSISIVVQAAVVTPAPPADPIPTPPADPTSLPSPSPEPSTPPMAPPPASPVAASSSPAAT